MTEQLIFKSTQTWLNSFIIAFNICPFAQREQQRNSIRYQVEYSNKLEIVLENLIMECRYLDDHPETETTLYILPTGFDDFDDYLDLLGLAEQLLINQAYEGIYQLASFHPNYCFETSEQNGMEQDPANYTNRSPYPMLHIIRESSIERAIAKYPNPEGIPENNIKLTRKLGLKKLQMVLANCYQTQ